MLFNKDAYSFRFVLRQLEHGTKWQLRRLLVERAVLVDLACCSELAKVGCKCQGLKHHRTRVSFAMSWKMQSAVLHVTHVDSLDEIILQRDKHLFRRGAFYLSAPDASVRLW